MKICVIIPTRKRYLDFNLFASTWKRTTEGYSDVIVGIDNDDDTYEELINSQRYPFIWERGPSRPLLHILNDLAVKYAEQYDVIGFLEDDCTFNTPKWESTIINKMKELGDTGFVWGSDMLNYDKVMGVPFINSNVIKRTGHITLPKFKTQFTDGYWLDLAKKLNTLAYIPEMVIEHRHFITGKRQKDETSFKVQFESTGEEEYYKSNQYQIDLNNDYEKAKGVQIPSSI